MKSTIRFSHQTKALGQGAEHRAGRKAPEDEMKDDGRSDVLLFAPGVFASSSGCGAFLLKVTPEVPGSDRPRGRNCSGKLRRRNERFSVTEPFSHEDHGNWYFPTPHTGPSP
ncbi:unnamed protein product [Pleuronectes platessa]|uniref:Uncharacterized protein n=1 Tax=Pleuronectes platessa TaxID=8262 RepID=A0A9N7ZAG4_PLEPL|nr:unnamed protein product [Pleuronectes platessa]